MANIKTSDTLPEGALDELEAALTADFMPADAAAEAETIDIGGEAEGHVEVETLSADTIDIDFAFTELRIAASIAELPLGASTS